MLNSTKALIALALGLWVPLLLGSGCGILIGNVKPVEEKSESYGVMDLSKYNPDWEKLSMQQTSPDPNNPDLSSTEVADVAYQSKNTASIISLNSACRKEMEKPEQDLRTLTNLLFLGMTGVTLRKEKPITVQNTPALETTIQAKLNNEPMMLRTVVLRRATCIYDLVYMARPRDFNERTSDFSRFVASLKLK